VTSPFAPTSSAGSVSTGEQQCWSSRPPHLPAQAAALTPGRDGGAGGIGSSSILGVAAILHSDRGCPPPELPPPCRPAFLPPLLHPGASSSLGAGAEQRRAIGARMWRA
jgi:hypothetical protein